MRRRADQAGKKGIPEIMVPVTCDGAELEITKKITDTVHAEVLQRFGLAALEYKYGTMIEIPRAALLADRMARSAEFFSFGTNDLTQRTFAFSRDDIGAFLNDYLDGSCSRRPLSDHRPGRVGLSSHVRQEGEPQAETRWAFAARRERSGSSCSASEQVNYVSCSPFRVTIARLAAAQAAY
jgi:pyruvate,orthophosphate dikinase